MRWGLVLVLALLGAAPAFAQQAPPPTDGLVIVGHGPDVPNVSGDTPNVAADSPVDLVPAPIVVVVPVPVFVGRPHHHRGNPAAAPVETARPNPFGRFLADPSRRFLNPIVPPGAPNS